MNNFWTIGPILTYFTSNWSSYLREQPFARLDLKMGATRRALLACSRWILCPECVCTFLCQNTQNTNFFPSFYQFFSFLTTLTWFSGLPYFFFNFFQLIITYHVFFILEYPYFIFFYVFFSFKMHIIPIFYQFLPILINFGLILGRPLFFSLFFFNWLEVIMSSLFQITFIL